MKIQLRRRLANNPRVRHLTKGASPRNETKTKTMNLAVKSAAKEMMECL